MNNRFIQPLLFNILYFFAVITSYACTTIFLNNNGIAPAVARSVDLYTSDQPLIFVLPRGETHNGHTGENSLTWKSKYASVVVTAFHSYPVSDGMNEKGLSAHLLYLSGSQYPKNNKRAISNLMWAQYILDNYATVAEAVKNTKNLGIIPTTAGGKTWPIHLSMQDASGNAAIIEYLNGKLQVYQGKQYTVMTNEPAYSIQLENLKKYQGFGGSLALPGDPDPLSRFVRAASYLKTLPKPKDNLEVIANVLSVMRTAMVPFGAVDTSGNKTEDAWATRWVSVSDLKNKIYYFNSTSTPNLIWIDLNKFLLNKNKSYYIDPTDIHLNGDVRKQLHSL